MPKSEEPRGFRRQGLPNAERSKGPTDDPRTFHKVASDMARGAEKEIQDSPTLHIRQDEVNAAKVAFIKLGRDRGTKVLEDELEREMRNMDTSRATYIRRLALTEAYLELTGTQNEDFLDSTD